MRLAEHESVWNRKHGITKEEQAVWVKAKEGNSNPHFELNLCEHFLTALNITLAVPIVFLLQQRDNTDLLSEGDWEAHFVDSLQRYLKLKYGLM